MVFPFFLTLAVFQSLFRLSPEWLPKRAAPLTTLVLAAVLAAIVIAVPWKGMSLVGWFRGLFPNVGIPLLALLLHAVWKNATGTGVLDKRDFRSIWVFGSISGLALYPASLGLCRLDPYALGYGSPWLSGLLLVLTVGLILGRNGLGVVLLMAVAAYNLRLQESPNLWDYLVDPILTLISLPALIKELALTLRRK